jgi:hypothetical protein
MPLALPVALGFFKSVEVMGSPSTLATTLSISSARITRAAVAIVSNVTRTVAEAVRIGARSVFGRFFIDG